MRINSKRKILIVEDDERQLGSLVRMLSKGYDVIPSRNIKEALAKLNKSVELVVSDIRLDDTARDNRDGLLLLKELRRRYPKLPIIMMTAYDQTGLVNEVLRLGGYHFLQKPINLDELEQVITAALKISQKSAFAKVQQGLRQGGPPALFFIFFISVWEITVKALRVPQYLVPSPSNVANTIRLSFPSLLSDTGVTLMEAFLGFLIGGGAAFFLAVVFAHSKTIERSIYPYFIALQAVPIIAIAPLLVIWFGSGFLGKVVMAAFVCFFPIVVNTTIGLKSVDLEAMHLLHTLSATKQQIFFKLRLPSSLPFLFAALKISATLSVIGAIVAELAGAKAGIGYRILIASYRIETSNLFASVIFAGLSGIIFFSVVSLIERRILRWKYLQGGP